MIVPILRKKALARVWNMLDSSGRIKHRQFKKLFTDSALKRIGLSREEFNQLRQFDIDQSRKIVEVFDLDQDDLNEISQETPRR